MWLTGIYVSALYLCMTHGYSAFHGRVRIANISWKLTVYQTLFQAFYLYHLIDASFLATLGGRSYYFSHLIDWEIEKQRGSVIWPKSHRCKGIKYKKPNSSPYHTLNHHWGRAHYFMGPWFLQRSPPDGGPVCLPDIGPVPSPHATQCDGLSGYPLANLGNHWRLNSESTRLESPSNTSTCGSCVYVIECKEHIYAGSWQVHWQEAIICLWRQQIEQRRGEARGLGSWRFASNRNHLSKVLIVNSRDPCSLMELTSSESL